MQTFGVELAMRIARLELAENEGAHFSGVCTPGYWRAPRWGQVFNALQPRRILNRRAIAAFGLSSCNTADRTFGSIPDLVDPLQRELDCRSTLRIGIVRCSRVERANVRFRGHRPQSAPGEIYPHPAECPPWDVCKAHPRRATLRRLCGPRYRNSSSLLIPGNRRWRWWRRLRRRG